MYILWYEPIKEKTSSNPLVKNEGVPLPWESNKGGVTNQVSDLGHVGYHSTSFNIPFRSGKKCNDESSIFIRFVPNWIWWFSHCHVYRRVNQNPSFHYTGHPSVSSQRRWCHACFAPGKVLTWAGLFFLGFSLSHLRCLSQKIKRWLVHPDRIEDMSNR